MITKDKDIKKEIINESVEYRAILEYKKFILENSKAAPKDSVYGNKLNPYLEAIDFAIYAILRGKNFKKGIHSEEKAKEVLKQIKFIDLNKKFKNWMTIKFEKVLKNFTDKEKNEILDYIVEKSYQ